MTLYLASSDLPFWGKSLNLDDVHNGHYLGLLELLSNDDPLLCEHLQKGRDKKKAARLTHYLSPESQNDFIGICGQRVLKTILYESEDAIHYLVICDATPDISHNELNVLLVRYVHKDKVQGTGDWEIIERFLEFKDLTRKTGSEISEMILSAMERVLT
jgi:hypothetical protein